VLLCHLAARPLSTDGNDDVEEQEHAMLFNADTCRWTILGDAAEVQRSYTRNQILTALEQATEPMSPADLTAATGVGRNNVDQRLHHMVRDGEIIKVSRGRYIHAKRPDLASKRSSGGAV
jgi:hypothetical protein